MDFSNHKINRVDVDRLQHLWDLIQQTHMLCQVLRTVITSIKNDTLEITTTVVDMATTITTTKQDEKNLFQKIKTHDRR
jgi:hypothetical protein